MAATHPLVQDVRQLRRWWATNRQALTPIARVTVTVAFIAVAYHYSLLTLLRSLNLETPLAYLGLVPFIALALGAARVRNGMGATIHDRQLDYILGAPLLIAAVAMNLLLPARFSTMFWVWRLDLLSMPLFAAGAIVLVFGARALWRLRLPIAFLLFAWPLPYTMLLLRWLGAFTNVTLFGLRAGLAIVPVAHATSGSDGSLFAIGSGKGQFTLSVASACAGVNGLVGFLLVSAAFLALVRGSRTRKLLWLMLGLFLIWTLNVVRILLIFAGGSAFGEKFALDALHPYLGLVTFNIGVVAMLLLLRPFGLWIAFGRQEPPDGDQPRRSRLTDAVPRARTPLTMVAGVALILAVSNAGLAEFDLIADDLGAPRLASLTDHPEAPRGWSVHRSADYEWGKRYFGDQSTWRRYSYTWQPGSSSPLQARAPIIADVISTTNLRAFSTYGIEACYRFHNYKLMDVRSVALGGGVVGKAIAYHSPKLRSDWTTLTWHWPVQTPKGKRYERVTVMLIGSTKLQLKSPQPSAGLARGLGIRIKDALTQDPRRRATDARLSRSRSFVAAFARTMIADQPAAPAGSRA